MMDITGLITNGVLATILIVIIILCYIQCIKVLNEPVEEYDRYSLLLE
jgi:hypothetical protein